MLYTLVVFFPRQPSTYSICELFSFKNLDFTRFIGYSCPEIVMDALLEITVSRIKSKIPCIASFSYGLRCNKASYSIFSLIISEYAWYSSIPSIASSFSSVIDKITSFVNAVYQHKNNTPDNGF